MSFQSYSVDSISRRRKLGLPQHAESILVFGNISDVCRLFCGYAMHIGIKVICVITKNIDTTPFNNFNPDLFRLIEIDFHDIKNQLSNDNINGVASAISFIGQSSLKDKNNHDTLEKENDIEFNQAVAEFCSSKGIRAYGYCSINMAPHIPKELRKQKSIIEKRVKHAHFSQLLILRPNVFNTDMLKLTIKQKMLSLFKSERRIYAKLNKSNEATANLSVAVAAVHWFISVMGKQRLILKPHMINQMFSENVSLKHMPSDLLA